MSTDLERAIRSYAEYLDETLPTITADEVRSARGPEIIEQSDPARPRQLWYRRPVVVFLVAMVAVLLIALLPVVFLGSRDTDVVDQPMSTTIAPQPPSTVALPPPEALVQVETTGGSLWAWEYDGTRIWRYADGRWEELPSTPGYVARVTAVGGSPWAITRDFDVRYLDGGTWHELDIPGPVWRIAGDSSSATRWISTGERLYRWDGGVVTEIDVDVVDDRYPDYTYVGDVAVTSDGTVWAAGLYGYAPMLGVLASYEPDTGIWEAVKPWNNKPVPAGLLAPTSTGGLWVLLDDWDDDESTGTSDGGWALAYRNGGTNQWDVYDDDLPGGRPFAIAADGGGVWLAQGYALAEGAQPMLGLYQFDGRTWTHYLDEVEVLDVAVAPDGTVWYIADQEPYVVRPLEP